MWSKTDRPSTEFLKFVIKLAAVYVLLGAGWIIGSDWLVHDVLPIDRTAYAQTLKGLVFVAVSGALVFFLAYRWVQEADRRARDIADAERLARMGSFSWTMGSQDVSWSDGIHHLLKYDDGMPVNLQRVRQQVHHPDDDERVMSWIAEGIERGAETLGPNVYRLLCKGGEAIWVEVNIKIERKAVGRVTVFGTCQDITSRIEMEAALLDAMAKAEQAANAKSVFLASMSHELRTPLNAIIGFSELIQMTAGREIAGKQLEYVESIRIAAQQLYGLVTNVLDLTQAEQIDFSVNLRAVRLQTVIAEALKQVDFMAGHSGIRIDNQAERQEEGLCLADPVRVRQILINLLSNAIKYNRSGGSVTIDLRDSALDRIVVRVSDTGYGIPEEQRGEIFNVFTRLNNQALMAGGTGLGLTIAKRLTERMGGEIGVDSVLGEGSTFWCEFPKVSVEQTDQP